MNIVYADIGGTTAFAAPARVPIRKSGNGWLPVPGWTGEFDWTGYIPFEALPHAVDSRNGRFVTANNKIVPDDYPYFLGRDWALPDRAERITTLLESQPKQSLGSTAAIAADTLSRPAARLLPLMLHVAPADERSTAALAVLRDWDARMTRESPAPLIFVAWLREFNRELFAAKLGDELQTYWSLHSVVIEHVLYGETSWCGGPAQPAPQQCATILSQSLARALDQLAGEYGDDMRRWHWGEAHQATFRNPVLAQVPVLGGWMTPRISAGGGKFTVNAGDMDIGNAEHPYRDTLGPGFRMILDFSDLTASQFMMSPGMSGNPLSAHYGDLLRGWRDLDWLVVGREQGGETLTLAPAGHAPP